MSLKPLFHQVQLRETQALSPFRRVIGKANFDLNTLRAGLAELGKLSTAPTTFFAVEWHPKELSVAVEEGEAFAVRALLVYATDVVDRYMRALAEHESLIVSPSVRSLMLAEFQRVPPTRPARPIDVKALGNAILQPGADVEKLMLDYRDMHLPRQRRPGLRERFDALMTLCPSVAPHHRAAFHVLVALRNRHAHGRSNDTISPAVANDWALGVPLLAKTHPNAKSADLLPRFQTFESPTAEDLTTLIALLHRTITESDADLIRAVNAEKYGEEVVARVIRERGAIDLAKKLWGLSERGRASKLLSFTIGRGFYRHARTRMPVGAKSVDDDIWLELANLTRSGFLSRIGVPDKASAQHGEGGA